MYDKAMQVELQADLALMNAEHEEQRTARRLESTRAEARRKRPRLVDDYAARARLWRPRSAEERTVLRERLAKDRARLDICSCADPRVPSWLCRVATCWSTAAGCICSERDGQLPGELFCTCMICAWSMPTEGRSEPPDEIGRRLHRDRGEYRCGHRPAAAHKRAVNADQVASSITDEELSEWCLHNCYPDPYQRGQSARVGARGTCILDMDADRNITGMRFVGEHW